MSERLRGTIIKLKDGYNRKPHFGFIKVADHPDVFVHVSRCRGSFLPSIGTSVEFELARRDGRLTAFDVSIIPQA